MFVRNEYGRVLLHNSKRRQTEVAVCLKNKQTTTKKTPHYFLEVTEYVLLSLTLHFSEKVLFHAAARDSHWKNGVTSEINMKMVTTMVKLWLYFCYA